MEVLFVLFAIALLLLLFSLKQTMSNRLQSVETELRRLREHISSISTEKDKTAETQPVPRTEAQGETRTIKQPWASGFTEIKETSLSGDLSSLLESASPAATIHSDAVPLEKKAVPPEQRVNIPSPKTPQPSQPSFLERNPDLEKFIGENLVSKIGIGILVLAIGFFVKYAIDNDWIGAAGRVGIGISFGGILVLVAHRLRNSYKAFSSVLVGGGLAIFYFTIALAYHQFHLFSQTVAFIIMIVITAFAVVLSELYNRQELAIIALVGGFATPFMVSEGSGNYKSLFTYLIILNSGLLIIAYNKAWRILNALAFLFTVILFGSWLFTLPGNAAATIYANGFLFGAIFFVLFFIINIAHNIRENQKFLASDFGILLLNTLLFFAAGLYFLTEMKAGEYRGLFTASLAVFNLAVSFALFRNRKTDRNILYLLVGITLSFVSLTAPIQLNGAFITLFWAAECVLLYWFFQKSNIPLVRLGSFLVWIAMHVSLFMDWVNVYGTGTTSLPVIINKGFVTTIFSAIACYMVFILRGRDRPDQKGLTGIYPHKQVFRSTGILLLYAAGAFEIGYQLNHHYPATGLQLVYLLAYSFAFVLLFSFSTEMFAPLRVPRYIHTIIMGMCILVYLITIPEIFAIQKDGLEQQRPGFYFAAHWIGAVLLALILYRLIGFARQYAAAIHKNGQLLSWALCTMVIIFLSAEIHLLINSLFFNADNTLDRIQKVYVKTGLPILWGLSSFGFMWLGMRHKFRTLRIISLTLFSIILLKLFLFDIRNIPVAGKIAAFFCLGILLLVVSFMYQRVKK